jgi:hypothetical protein
MAKKKKDIPFHIVHNYKHWTSDQGYKFWARDEEDAKLYLGVIGAHLGSLKEVEVKNV